MKIERRLMNSLVEWKNSSTRKPLILRGVRQCGKTWLLQEFGQRYFESTAYFNFENQEELADFFEREIDPERILINLGVMAGIHIEAHKTLVIFDEIQNCPKALNSLKYFCEQKREYAIVAAGSLLGITLSAQIGFPVGKVNFLDLNPCSFAEYLAAVAPQLAEYCHGINTVEPLPQPFCSKLETYLRDYIALGGMPETLGNYLDDTNFAVAEQTLTEIVNAYELDFSKHAPSKDIPKLLLLWQAIPECLARENAKFMYGEVRPGARAKDLEDALRWLQESGLVNKINNVKTPQLPLSAYEERRNFKLYLSDTGVLRKLAKLPSSVVIANKDIFGEFKGRLIENFVQQELKTLEFDPICYWTSAAAAEVDFVIQHNETIVPVEVKSGLNLHSRSLHVYRERYKPALSIRCSLQNLKFDDGLLNIPLYLIDELPRLMALL
ncbi:MAG: AAA family ATPase [Victivallaceae bacterium]|nr:AAA family ATPase [Victivallaceae bacterium]